jgi:hypothetical protein
MADLAVRLLQLRGEFAKEFSLSEGHSLVQQAARVGLQIESMTVRICDPAIKHDQYIECSRLLSSLEAALAELRDKANKFAPPQPLTVYCVDDWGAKRFHAYAYHLLPIYETTTEEGRAVHAADERAHEGEIEKRARDLLESHGFRLPDESLTHSLKADPRS